MPFSDRGTKKDHKTKGYNESQGDNTTEQNQKIPYPVAQNPIGNASIVQKEPVQDSEKRACNESEKQIYQVLQENSDSKNDSEIPIINAKNELQEKANKIVQETFSLLKNLPYLQGMNCFDGIIKDSGLSSENLILTLYFSPENNLQYKEKYSNSLNLIGQLFPCLSKQKHEITPEEQKALKIFYIIFNEIKKIKPQNSMPQTLQPNNFYQGGKDPNADECTMRQRFGD